MLDYNKYNEEPFLLINASIVQDYAEFSNQDVLDVSEKIRNFKKLNIENFGEKEDAELFYHYSKTYIYDLLSAHPDLAGPGNKLNKFLPGIMTEIQRHPGKKFLEFGGGIGDVCQIMQEWGNKDVTYMDIESHITEFARWRFLKYKIPMKMNIIPQDDFSLEDTYDIIFQDAVLEHLSPEKQISYTAKLSNGVNSNGLFIMIVDLSGASVTMPMHFNVDIQKVHNTIEQSGLVCLRGKNEFASVWKKV